jgi:hypothetical protein
MSAPVLTVELLAIFGLLTLAVCAHAKGRL